MIYHSGEQSATRTVFFPWVLPFPLTSAPCSYSVRLLWTPHNFSNRECRQMQHIPLLTICTRGLNMRPASSLYAVLSMILF